MPDPAIHLGPRGDHLRERRLISIVRTRRHDEESDRPWPVLHQQCRHDRLVGGRGVAQALDALLADIRERLDETQPGSGFGLAIAAEIAETYGGSLVLDRAGLGGLAVTFRIPLS